MLSAARALGLTAILTFYLSYKEVKAALGLRADWHSYALLPIGYPMGRFGPVRRSPLKELVYADRWGQAKRTPARWRAPGGGAFVRGYEAARSAAVIGPTRRRSSAVGLCGETGRDHVAGAAAHRGPRSG